MNDVNITNNTKSSVGGNVIWDASTAFVFVGGKGIIFFDPYVGCSGVTFTNVKVNNNTINNVNASGFEWQTFEAMFFGYCKHCTLIDCETSNNVDVLGASGNDFDTEDYFFDILRKFNCCQS